MTRADPIDKPLLLGPGRDQIAILTSAVPPAGDTAVLLMNAGMIHRVGPNRLNVQLARHAARLGYPALRLDLSGFGDSAPHPAAKPFEDQAVEDLQRAMDHLEATLGVRRFIPAGLCSGADVSLALAARDPRVISAILVDPFSYETRLYWLQGYAQRLVSKESWRSFLLGDSQLRQTLRQRVKGALGIEAPAPIPAAWEQPEAERVISTVRAAVERGARLFVAYSGGPAWYNYLAHLRPAFAPHRRSERVIIERFSEADHTFTLTHHRQELLAVFERWLKL